MHFRLAATIQGPAREGHGCGYAVIINTSGRSTLDAPFREMVRKHRLASYAEAALYQRAGAFVVGSVFERAVLAAILSPWWIVPLPAAPGGYSPTIAVNSPVNGGGMFCEVLNVSQTGTATYQTGWIQFPPVVNGPPSYQFAFPIVVPTNGFMYLVCQMGNGTSLYSVNY